MSDASASYYPEQLDKPHNEPPKTVILNNRCAPFFISGYCENGHRFAKELVCGREWCEDCGKPMSDIHKRRISRWWGKALQMPKMGYLVITVPYELREKFIDKKVLSEFRTYAKRKLQRMGYVRGLIRYHWAGDCVRCKGKGCNHCQHTGADKIFKPHLNILIDEGYLKKEDFENKFKTFREDLGIWFNQKFKKDLSKPVTGNLFFSYATADSHKVHKLKYITRATWRFYRKDICDVLKGFRSTSVWGKKGKHWKDGEVKRKSELVSLESGECPCCGYKIQWKKEFLSRKVFQVMQTDHINAGYYLIKDDP